MSDYKILRTTRGILWNEAKGKLGAMKQTFWDDADSREGQYDELSEKIEVFIKDVEDYGLHE